MCQKAQSIGAKRPPVAIETRFGYLQQQDSKAAGGSESHPIGHCLEFQVFSPDKVPTMSTVAAVGRVMAHFLSQGSR